MKKAERALMIGLDSADAVLVKRLIEAGRLPAMQKVMENGVSQEDLGMLGVFPTVTPTNWATLCTGANPITHGVTCFQNHTLGKSLGILEMNWDARRMHAEAIWEKFEEAGKRSIMLNYCQAWPNRVPGSKNIFIDGTGVEPFLRCTADFQKTLDFDLQWEKLKTIPHFVDQNSSDCVVYGDQVEKFAVPEGDIKAMVKDGLFTEGMPLLESPAFVIMNYSPEQASKEDVIDRVYAPLKEPENWNVSLPEGARVFAYPVNKGLGRHYAVVSQADGKQYDTVTFYANRHSEPLGSAKIGQWTDWLYCSFLVEEKEKKVAYKMRIVDIADDGESGRIYMSHTMNLDVSQYIYPHELAQELIDCIGPMLPHGLFERYTPEGRTILMETFEQNMDWHIRAAQYLMEKYDDWGLFYTHLHGIDLVEHWYINEAFEGSSDLWQENLETIYQMYEISDRFIAAMLPYLEDGKTTLFITSDHGQVPRSAGYHNPGISDLSGINCKVMSDLGYTVAHPVPDMDGIYFIDWSKTRAIQSRSSYIYINLKGRDPEGIVDPADYKALQEQIIDDLYSYRDPISKRRVVAFAMTMEEARSLGVGGEHTGDVFFQLNPDFGEEHAMAPSYVTNHGFSLISLCMMCGAGLKRGEFIKRPIHATDVVPTICDICGVGIPAHCEGGIIYQALEGFDEKTI